MEPTILGAAGNTEVTLSHTNRTQGIALIGKNGTGKSSLIRSIFNQEMQSSGATLLLFDPHGDLAHSLLLSTSSKELVFLSPETVSPFGLNLLEADPNDYEAVERTVNVAIEIFKKIIGSDTNFMPRFEYIFGSLARTILYSHEGLTLAEVPLLLTDLQFSRNIARNLENPELRHFWEEYERSFWNKAGNEVRPYDRFMYLESVSNRISTLLQNELLYRIVSHSRSTIRFDELLESGKAVVVSLPMGRLGSGAVSLLGSILLAKCAEAIYQRGMNQRRVHVYVDEYGQYFATPFTADLLTQGRKYNVSTLVSMQTLDQLPDEKNTAAVLNAGNLLVFSVIGKDADILSKQFPLPGALPERTDVMAPYIISPTPVEDIWRKGHPSAHVQVVRDNLFILLHRLETQPYEKVFTSPRINTDIGRELQTKFANMEDYCTSREQVVEGLNKLNELIVGFENYPYSEENQMLLYQVILLFRGYMGVYPQNHKDTEGDYAGWVERRVEKGVMDPRRLEQDYEWVPQTIPRTDVEKLWQVFLLCSQGEEAILPPARTYTLARLNSLPRSLYTEEQLFRFPYTTADSAERQRLYIDRIGLFEIGNLVYWVNLLDNMLFNLRLEPVMTQSSTYVGQRTDRPVGDMKEELSMRLATLPNYTALCNLLQDDGTIQTVQIRTLKG